MRWSDRARLDRCAGRGRRPPGPAADAAARREGLGTVGIRFCCPEQDCTVTGLDLPRLDQDAALIEAVPPARVDTELRCPPAEYVSRFTYLIAAGAGLEDCTAHLDRLEQAVRLHSEPAVCIASALSYLIHSTPPRGILCDHACLRQVGDELVL